MLAKIPQRRKDGKSDFADLIEYITNRNEERENFSDELDPSDRRRHHQILERARSHLVGAEEHLRAARRTDSIDADAIRVRLEGAPRAAFADGSEYGRFESGVGSAVDEFGGVDANPHQRSIARARHYLRAAAGYLRQAPQTDRDFQERARARRAYLAVNAQAAQRRHERDERSAIAELESDRLLSQTERIVTDTDVACEHNCLSLSTASAEMKAVAAQNVRAKNPVYHIVLSWPASESPSDEQAFDCGAHALAAVGMTGHQYVFAVHRDTNNVHLHIAVNRIHPDTFAAVYPERDYFKLDRAMRELELRYGWQHDKGPYAVFERNGKTVIDWSSKGPSTKGKRPAQAANMERHGGQESLFSYARGEPRKALLLVLKNDKLTWPKLHSLLAKYSLELREKGQGFAIFDRNSDATTPIKASDMHEELSKGRLTKRLGPFEPAASTIELVSTYDKYCPPKRDPQQREERRQERAQARRDLRARYEEYKNGFVYRRLDADAVRQRYTAVREDARRRRQEVRNTVTDPAARKALYSVIAFETLRARERLRREIRRERDALRADQANRRQPYRKWVERQAAAGDAAAISQLRGIAYSEKRQAKELARAIRNVEADGIVHDDDVEPVARDLFVGIHYRVRRDGAVAYRTGDGREEFIDYGQKISVPDHARCGDDTIAAALRLAAEKYGGAFKLTGTDNFKRRAIEVMVKYKVGARLKSFEQESLRHDLSGPSAQLETGTGRRQR